MGLAFGEILWYIHTDKHLLTLINRSITFTVYYNKILYNKTIQFVSIMIIWMAENLTQNERQTAIVYCFAATLLYNHLSCPQYLCSLIAPLTSEGGGVYVYPPFFPQYCKNNIIYEQDGFITAKTILNIFLIFLKKVFKMF